MPFKSISIMKQIEAILVVMKWVFGLGAITFLAFAIERLVHPTPFNAAGDTPFLLMMWGMSLACIILHVLCENAVITLNNDKITVE